MKLSIFNEQAKEPKPEPEIALRFTRPTSGPRDRIMVSAVNPVTGETLDCGNLISIFEDGTFQRCFAAKFGDKTFRIRS